MTEAETRALFAQMLAAHTPKLYQSLDELPDWAKATVEKLLENGAIKGNDAGLNLSYDQLRLLVINDRAGLYQA